METEIINSLPEQQKFIEKKGELFIRGYETRYNVTFLRNVRVSRTRTITQLELHLEDNSIFPVIFQDRVGYELNEKQVTFREETETISNSDQGKQEFQITKKQKITPFNKRFPSYEVFDTHFESC